MDDLVERLMRAWTALPEDDDAALAAFTSLYVSPVPINGTPFTTAEILARARMLHAAFSDLRHELIDVVEAPGRLVVAFRLRGRHTGTYATPLGPLGPTGRDFSVRTIDVLSLGDDGRVTEVVVQADDLGLLSALGALPIPT
jgi:ketosteroid isomerase-like protein